MLLGPLLVGYRPSPGLCAPLLRGTIGTDAPARHAAKASPVTLSVPVGVTQSPGATGMHQPAGARWSDLLRQGSRLRISVARDSCDRTLYAAGVAVAPAIRLRGASPPNVSAESAHLARNRWRASASSAAARGTSVAHGTKKSGADQPHRSKGVARLCRCAPSGRKQDTGKAPAPWG